jgi:monoterpene epsilon-lactone hydrolase
MASAESRRVADYWAISREAGFTPDPGDFAANAGWEALTGEPGGVDYLEVVAGGLPALWALPHGIGEDAPLLLCFHGGGYRGGSMFTHRKMFAHLAKAVGARALVPDYTLLPEGTYPRPIVEGVGVYRWLLEDERIPAARIAFAGDSAGGGLAITVQLRARGEELPLPAATMLISPWTDFETAGESMVTNLGKDAFFTKEMIGDLGGAFLAGHDPRDPQTMPLHADLGGFGPIYAQVGDRELLLDDCRMFVKHAQDAGVDVQLDVFADQQHSFQMAAGGVPEADDAIARFAAWARPKLSVAERV